MERLKEDNMAKFKTISLYFFSATGAILGFLLNLFLARAVSIEALDRIKYVISLATILSNILVLGLPSFLIREASNKNNPVVFDKCITLFLLALCFEMPIFFYYLFNFSSYSNGNVYLSWLVIGIALFLGFNSLISAYCLGRKKYHLTYILESIIPKSVLFISLIVFICLGMSGLLSRYYLIVYLIIYVFVAVLFLVRNFKRITIHFKKTEIISICFFFGITITQTLSNNLTPVLQKDLFPDIVGVTSTISLSVSLLSVIDVFTGVLNNITKPLFAHHSRQKEDEKILNIYRFGTRVNSYISIPVYVFLAIHSNKFLAFFNPELVKYSLILSLISLKGLFGSLFGITGSLLAMTNHEKNELFNSIAHLGVFALACLIFSFNRIYGLAIALVIGEIFLTVLKFIEVCFIFKKLAMNLKSILTLIIIIAIDSLIVFAYKFIPISNLYFWIGIGIVIGLCLIVVNFALSLYRKKDFKLLFKIGDSNNESC